MPPPPPPVVFEENVASDNEALSSMLMAWYMSGYHTGFYQVSQYSWLCIQGAAKLELHILGAVGSSNLCLMTVQGNAPAQDKGSSNTNAKLTTNCCRVPMLQAKGELITDCLYGNISMHDWIDESICFLHFANTIKDWRH